jgi:hypothetical protein
MSLTKEQIIFAAMELDPEAREEVAEQLLLSLPASPRPADADLVAISEERYQKYLRGESKASTVEEVIQRIANRSRVER